jgi:UDP-N-acetylmuramoyl-L-alanyl-D-glutamate--2,6-diaminopimelate ligase
MLLSQILRGFDGSGMSPEVTGPDPSKIDISGITYDSKEIQSGWIFVAIPGRKVDGHTYIPGALAQGASAIVGSYLPDDLNIPPEIPYVRVSDPRRAVGLLACELEEQPSNHMAVIGVTGTDGKTTTTNLIAAIFDAAGYKTGLTSTVDFKVGDERIENTTRFTNLEAPQLQRLLARMRDVGVQFAIVESTSSGLELERLAGIAYDVAVITNISSEHLEVHGTKENYWRAKAILFERIDPTYQKNPGLGFTVPRACILNADDSSYAFLSQFCRTPILRYGIDNPGANINAKNLVLHVDGSEFDVRLPDGQQIHITTPLLARFNVSNCLAAITVAWNQGIPTDIIIQAMATFSGVPGRMERIIEGQEFAVIVDYAHTAESLRQVLAMLRPLTPGRLIAVFGSAGDRDIIKRPEMGKAAAELADFFVITDEDPRAEDPMRILRDIAEGAISQGAEENRDFVCQVGRRDGIARAFAKAQTGDTVVLCGKGHEQSIVIGEEKIPWDDRSVARELLKTKQ